MVTHGSSEAILLAMATVVERGDEIIVLAPVYHALSAVAQSLGATLKVWELSPEDGFRPDLEDLRRLLGARTKAVVVNFPHNPTGATLSANQYAEFVELINRRGVFLFWDGAFSDLHYETPGLLDPVASVQKCVSFGTLSKAYGLPGVRIGWCFAPEPVLREMVKLRDYTTISCSPLLEHLAAAVVERADLLIAPRLAQAAANRAQLAEWAAANLDIVEYTPPLGGVTVFPRFASDGGTTEVCEDLAREDGVLVVPGSCFGLSNHIRIGFGGPSELLSTGLERLTARVRKAA
jgi:aspartate/methionine/tyrosine aminotransferase